MSEQITSYEPMPASTHRRVRPVLLIVLVVLATVGFLGYSVWKATPAEGTLGGTQFVSAAQLEARHGLGVRLIGVTAGGGMIDVRLKIHNVEKARRFLEDPNNMPRLIAAESGEALPRAEGLADGIRWEEGGILFIFFANNGGLIQPGTPVIVEFSDVRLEPIVAQ